MSKKDFWDGYVPEPAKPYRQLQDNGSKYFGESWDKAEQPAQQEPKIDIYRSFEQWKSGNVLEHGVPRTEHYSEAQLDLVEMGWNYGYDAGRAVEQALDKKAENARELGLDYEPAQQEPVAWGCNRYIEDDKGFQIGTDDPELAWGKYAPDDNGWWPLYKSPPAQRTWVGLTDEEIFEIKHNWITTPFANHLDFARAIEAKLRSKNT